MLYLSLESGNSSKFLSDNFDRSLVGIVSPALKVGSTAAFHGIPHFPETGILTETAPHL